MLNFYYIFQEVVRKIHESQKGLPLKILSLAKDCPPGKPEAEFFGEALNNCQYTCILVSR